jgi:cyclophilin family peptidyl-prolyl cis-trans isomerase
VLGGCGQSGSNGPNPAADTPAANIAGGKTSLSSTKPGNAPLKNNEADPLHPAVLLETSLGDITVTLDREKAPRTVDNFLEYVNETYYQGTIIHQVVKGHHILAGGYDANYVEKQSHPPILNEAHNGLKNVRGTIAMARSPDDVNSATCQFFINVADNPSLDFRERTADGYGYCVFGQVTEGMEVVDRIAETQVHDSDAFERTPSKAVVISATRQIK